MPDINKLTVRIRRNGQPKREGVGLQFSADGLEWDDPEHVTALDMFAAWLIATTDDTGPDLETWKREATLQ